MPDVVVTLHMPLPEGKSCYRFTSGSGAMSDLLNHDRVAELRRQLAEVAKNNLISNVSVDYDTFISLLDATDMLREVAEIAERFHQTTSSRYRPVEWLEAEARWLAVRDKVISKENDHA